MSLHIVLWFGFPHLVLPTRHILFCFSNNPVRCSGIVATRLHLTFRCQVIPSFLMPPVLSAFQEKRKFLKEAAGLMSGCHQHESRVLFPRSVPSELARDSSSVFPCR